MPSPTESSSAVGSPPPSAEAVALGDRLEQRTATVAIVGLGYVGLPLARAVHAAGYGVIGFDSDASKVEMLQAGQTYLRHLGEELAHTLARSDRFEATDDASRIADADVVVLCVPTPLAANREPDLSFVLESTRMVAAVLRRGQLIVLESTTYPGTTRDEMMPILAETGLACGTDYFLGYSPEREDPGRPDTSTTTIPKLVGGVDAVSARLAHAFYERVVEHAHLVSSTEVAEAAKLLENIYRAVNIALVNELKVLLTHMGIDVWEVVEAASTKPFGFQPFYPGPGLGGHCIPIDPFYLAWRAKSIGGETKFIELAGEVNARMPQYVVSRTEAALQGDGRTLADAKVLVLGVAYKADVDDIRESPAAEIITLLQGAGATVAYHDPLIPVFPKMRRYAIDLRSVELDADTLRTHDAVIVVTNHRVIDYELVGAHAKLIVDTRNAMAGLPVAARIVKA